MGLTAAESPQAIRKLVGANGLPEIGTPARDRLEETADLLLESLFNKNPTFGSCITSSAAIIVSQGRRLDAEMRPDTQRN